MQGGARNRFGWRVLSVRTLHVHTRLYMHSVCIAENKATVCVSIRSMCPYDLHDPGPETYSSLEPV